MFPGKYKKSRVKKKRKRKGLGDFYSVCRLVQYKAVGSRGSGWSEEVGGGGDVRRGTFSTIELNYFSKLLLLV